MYTFQQENADFARILQGCKPYAAAYVKGSAAYPLIGGRILFYPAGDRGVLVVSNVRGLPVDDTACGARFFGMHIHEKGDCHPSDGETFSDAGTHYNPSDCTHPAHAGDLPPLFANARGKAWSAVLCDRFSVSEIIGKSVIIHKKPDDFTIQPSGNAGARIACGTIIKAHR